MLRNKKLLILIKSAVSIALYWIIYSKIQAFSGWNILYEKLQSRFDLSILTLLALIFLAILNLSSEAKKWQILLQLNNYNISFFQSFKNVLLGFSAGTVTPNNLGEVGGRIFFLPKNKRLSGGTLFFLGSIIQTTIIAVVGISSIVILSSNYYEYILNLIPITDGIKIYILIAFTFILVLIFLLIQKRKTIYQWPFIKRISTIQEVFTNINTKSLLKVVLFTSLRYLIYCLQVYIAIWLIDTSSDIEHVAFVIPIYFLGVTIIPSFFWIDPAIRASIALLVFAPLAITNETAVYSIFIIWIMNVAIPSLAGSLFLLNKKN